MGYRVQALQKILSLNKRRTCRIYSRRTLQRYKIFLSIALFRFHDSLGICELCGGIQNCRLRHFLEWLSAETEFL